MGLGGSGIVAESWEALGMMGKTDVATVRKKSWTDQRSREAKKRPLRKWNFSRGKQIAEATVIPFREKEILSLQETFS